MHGHRSAASPVHSRSKVQERSATDESEEFPPTAGTESSFHDKRVDSARISSSGGIRCPCSPSAPAPPPHLAATWAADPHPKVLVRLSAFALTFSLSQIPAGEATTQLSLPRNPAAAPAVVNEVVQSNFFQGPQGSRNLNGENRRVNKTESGGWCFSGWKKLFLKPGKHNMSANFLKI